jgi:hypothetical protein
MSIKEEGNITYNVYKKEPKMFYFLFLFQTTWAARFRRSQIKNRGPLIVLLAVV